MKNLNVLLVEDEVIIAMLIRRELKKIGYNVIDLATSGEEAIQITKEDRPDLILMDITLAGEMDGITAASEIKKNGDIPIIFVTGYQDRATRERAALTKPLGYFVKPLQIDQLKSLIDSHF
ncbi:response regulator [Leptospira selangorensis]|uniref:Response regulator n=1 Tax=Leptospira selangorensis TaxID=2484982 RepID=A0A5F2BVX4_9LEPT|nr:response regulator [Leptospira selangorensis]TGM12047.1 response regulator [Leptospira selangorensis]TGM15092.1 response regulator [Leptospira selangorensis]